MTVTALGRETSTTFSHPGRRKSVLLLGIRQESLLRLAPQLGQKGIELVAAAEGRDALELATGRRFELVIVRHPVAGMPIDELFEGLRRPGSRSVSSYVLVLTESASAESLQELAGERSSFANATDFDMILAVVSRKVLGVARRAGSRLMVQLGLRMLGARVSHFCQVVNISESGMLVRTSDRPEVGEEVGVTFSLPEVPHPIEARGRVVRHTGPPEVDGVAVRFVGLDRASRSRVRDYVGGQLAAQPG